MNGPVLACFVVYEEFQHYKSGEFFPDIFKKSFLQTQFPGIYESQTSPLSKDLYGHCAKLIGWGEENGTKYWTYMNTWGREFGLNGFFKTSEAPEEVAAGIPF